MNKSCIRIYFCFLNQNSEVEQDDDGREIYHCNKYLDLSIGTAIKEFHKEFEEVDNKPEIVDIVIE